MPAALTFSRPQHRLAAARPTARLLGMETVLSIVSQLFINVIFSVGAIVLLFQQPWFNCFEFDVTRISRAYWWESSDNYEAAVVALLYFAQNIGAAGAASLGYIYRQSWFRNVVFDVLLLGIVGFSSMLAIGPPSNFSCLFRINCGEETILGLQGYDGIGVDSYNNMAGHNLFPASFKYQVWIFGTLNIVVVLAVEKLFFYGPIRKWFKAKGYFRKQKYALVKDTEVQM